MSRPIGARRYSPAAAGANPVDATIRLRARTSPETSAVCKAFETPSSGAEPTSAPAGVCRGSTVEAPRASPKGPHGSLWQWQLVVVSNVGGGAIIRLELGVKPTCQGHCSTDAIDPKATSALIEAAWLARSRN